MSALSRLEISGVVHAPPDAVFDAVCDIEARARNMEAFRRVEITERSPDGFVATMYEHYAGRDVVITSRFRFERPGWLTYEHLDGPFGVNRGRFTILAEGDATRVDHVHETEQDVAEGSELRDQWLRLMEDQLDAIRLDAERGRAPGR
jgi:ribosome-associated toxin RatA of RatAB toxin-antitoxin module